MPKDPFVREKFTKERSAARRLAAEYFQRGIGSSKCRFQPQISTDRARSPARHTLRRQRRCDQASVSDHHHNQGDGKRCRRDEVRKTIVDHAGAVAGAAIFSFSSLQVLRTSAVISVTFSI